MNLRSSTWHPVSKMKTNNEKSGCIWKRAKRVYDLVWMEKRRNDTIINSKIKNKSKKGKKEKRKTKPNNNKTKYITKLQCIHFQNTLLGD